MPSFRFLRQMVFDGRGAPAAPIATPDPQQWKDDALTGSVLGHSTVLLNFFGLTVITDPVFSRRVGPGVPPLILGPKRYLAPALPVRRVPAPDVIVLSHAHFDHLDVWSLRKFDRQTPVVTAQATGDILRRHGFRQIHELHWGESSTITTARGALTVTALEVAHWGARMMRDDYRGYNGYLLARNGHSICFAGDTAATTAFRRLRRPPVPVDLALMPIGAYDPWIRAHCNPEQAVAMARDAGARSFVPIHHETFKLSVEAMDEPATRLRAALHGQSPELLALHVGETFHVPVRVAHAAIASGGLQQ